MLEYSCQTVGCINRNILYTVLLQCPTCNQLLQQIPNRKRIGEDLQAAASAAKNIKADPIPENIHHALTQLTEAVTLPDANREDCLEIDDDHYFIFNALLTYKQTQRIKKGRYLHVELFSMEEEIYEFIDNIVAGQILPKLKYEDFQCVIQNDGHFFVCSVKYHAGKWHFLLIDTLNISVYKNGLIPHLLEYIRKVLPTAEIYLIYTDRNTASYQHDYLCYFHAIEMAFRLSSLNFAACLAGPSNVESALLYQEWLKEMRECKFGLYAKINQALLMTNIQFIQLKHCPPALNRVFSGLQSSKTYSALSAEFKSAPASRANMRNLSFAQRLNRRHASGLHLLQQHYISLGRTIAIENYPDINDDPYYYDREEIENLVQTNPLPADAKQYPNATVFRYNYGITYFALKYLSEVRDWLAQGTNYAAVTARIGCNSLLT